MSTPFLKELDLYTRDLDPLGDALSIMAFHLQKTKNISEEKARDALRQMVGQKGTRPIIPKKIKYVDKDNVGDRVVYENNIHNFLKDVLAKDEIMAPTMTTFAPTGRNPSLNRNVLIDLKSDRVKLKEDMFVCEQKGDGLGRLIANAGQNKVKVVMNSNSGANSVKSTPTYNAIGHSVLTSNCRIMTSYTNATIEKFLAGNRHYWSADITLENIHSICCFFNKKQMSEVIDKYNIHIPTVDETMQVIQWSTDIYWNNFRKINDIKEFVKTLSDLERTAFVYIGDFYHLRLFNDQLIRNVLDDLSGPDVTGIVDDDPDVFKKLNEEQGTLLLQSLNEMIRENFAEHRKGLSEEEKKRANVMSLKSITNPDDQSYSRKMAKKILLGLNNHSDFFKTFFRMEFLPPSIGNIADSMRRVVATSDTDSSLFTTVEWVNWKKGNVFFDQEAYATQGSLVYFISEILKHIFAKISMIIGFDKDDMFLTSMKNEYRLDSYSITTLTKTYYATENAKEQNLYFKPSLLVKGSTFTGSNLDSVTQDYLSDMIEGVLSCMNTGYTMNHRALLQYVANVEHGLYERMNDNDTSLLTRGDIKDDSAYKNGEDNANYRAHAFWNEVFGDKYGVMPPPPYDVTLVNVDLKTKRETDEWIVKIKDPKIQLALEKYLTKHGRNSIGSNIRIPTDILETHDSIPEISMAMAKRNLAIINTRAFYVVLSSLGIFYNYDKAVRLVSDDYPETRNDNGELIIDASTFQSDERITIG